ncbi:hypothetical protein F5X97DRAFT_112794 [Nemania serpens]|nr:hypothetical protein F5X97DRAFT_112794 [Nemania serpens]
MAYRLRSYHRADQMLTRGHCQRQPNNAEYPQVTRRWNMIRSPRAYNIRLSSATLRGREPNSQGIPNSARGPVVNGSSPASPVLQPYSTTLGYAPMSVLVICFSGHIPKKMHWVSFWKKPPATYLPTYCSEVCQTVVRSRNRHQIHTPSASPRPHSIDRYLRVEQGFDVNPMRSNRLGQPPPPPPPSTSALSDDLLDGGTNVHDPNPSERGVDEPMSRLLSTVVEMLSWSFRERAVKSSLKILRIRR